MSSTKFVARHGINSLGDLIVTGSITATGGISISGSVTSASFATSASQAQNATSSSFAFTASYAENAGGGAGFPFSGSAVITGSLQITNLTGSGVRYVVTDSDGNVTAQQASASILSTQTVTASAGQTSFNITNGYTTGLINVFVNGTKLNESEYVDTNGTSITFITGSMLNDVVEFQRYLPALGVTNNALRSVNYFTAVASQSVFSASYTPGLLDVFYNGSKLSNTDYTANDGSTIALATASAAGDIIEVDVYSYQVGAFSGLSGEGTLGQISYFNTSNSITGSPNFTISGSTMTVTGSLLVSGSGTFTNIGPAIFSGSVTAVDGFTGSFSGTATNATSASQAQNAVSASYALTASFALNVPQTASFAISASFATDANLLDGKDSTEFATTGSNTFTGTQHVSNTTDATSFTSTAALYTDGGLRVTKDAFVSGGLSIAGNLTVFGTSSVNFITSSTLIGLEFINLNTDLPALRYAGINVGDSGSAAGISSSFWYDSESNDWVFIHTPASSEQVTSSLAIFGPATYNSLGNEVGIRGNYLTKGQVILGDTDHDHHITSSQIYDDGTTVAIEGNLQVTGSLLAGSLTGSLFGTASQAVSASFATTATTASFAQTASFLSGGVPSPFPFTGSAIITGSLIVTGSTIMTGSLGVTGSLNLSYIASIGSIWTARTSMITARRAPAGVGTSTAALAIGGYNPGTTTCTELFNGTSWSTGGALINGKFAGAGAGTSTSALTFGGAPTGNCTEAYNGTSWSAGGAMINASRRDSAGAGASNTAALAFGGGTPACTACTEAYNGTSWSTGGAMITARTALGGAGTDTSALAWGGSNCISSPSVFCTCTEAYNGTAWSAGGALPLGLRQLGSAGTSATAAISVAGRAPFGASVCTFTYNGSTWTKCSNYLQDRCQLGAAGTTANALAFGGNFPNTTGYTAEFAPAFSTCNTFTYSATTGQVAATGSLFGTASFATTATIFPFTGSAIISGSLIVTGSTIMTGSLAVITTGTELQVLPGGVAIGNTATDLHSITGSTAILGNLSVTGSINNIGDTTFCFNQSCAGATSWSSAAAMITARQTLSGAGIQNAALAFGGLAPGRVSCTEAYNGTSWSTGGAMISGRAYLAGVGTQTAALAVAGYAGPVSTACTECYNGSTWTTLTAVPGGNRYGLAGGLQGTTSAALVFGGAAPGFTRLGTTNLYNGSSWSTGGSLATPRYQLGGAGTSTSALAFGGNIAGITAATEAYNGTAWSGGGNLINGNRDGVTGAGASNTAALAFGGQNVGTTNSELYNGTSWSTTCNMTNARREAGNSGTSIAALASGGTQPTRLSCSECFTIATTITPRPVLSTTTAGAMVLAQVSSSLNFANDTAAAAGGVPLGGLYRNGGVIQIRLV